LNPLLIGIELDRELRRQKITKRLSDRLNNGLIEEVENLLTLGLNHADLAYYGLEYKWISKYLLKEISKKELFENLNIAIHQFAKKQMTWFRRMEKNGANIHWLDAFAPLEENLEKIDQLFHH
jgi:tRNA dimethylallyltransferase